MTVSNSLEWRKDLGSNPDHHFIQFQGCPNHEPLHGEQYLADRALQREPGHLGSDLVVLPLLLSPGKQLPDLWEDPCLGRRSWGCQQRKRFFHHRCLCWFFSRAKREAMSSLWIGGQWREVRGRERETQISGGYFSFLFCFVQFHRWYQPVCGCSFGNSPSEGAPSAGRAPYKGPAWAAEDPCRGSWDSTWISHSLCSQLPWRSPPPPSLSSSPWLPSALLHLPPHVSPGPDHHSPRGPTLRLAQTSPSFQL